MGEIFCAEPAEQQAAAGSRVAEAGRGVRARRRAGPASATRTGGRSGSPDPDGSVRRGRARRPAAPQKKRRKKSRSAGSSGDESPPRKKAKAAKRKKVESSSSSSSDSSDSSSGSDTERDSAGSKSSGEDSVREGGSKKRKMHATWDLLNDIWPLEERPRKLQDKRYVGRLSWPTLMALQDRYEKEAEKKGVGSAIYGKDRRLKKIRFRGKADDGYAKLHKARWLRLPMAAPDKYWRKVPRAHEQRFRHLQLAHYGAESQINEKVILSLHDRQVPVELKMLLRGNYHRDSGKGTDLAEPAEVRHLQEAVCNYMTACHVLWPFDYGPLVILRVLIENRWGEAAGGDMRERVGLVTRFFNEVVGDNSGRAVRGEPPLDYEKVRAKWGRQVEMAFPQLGFLAGAGQATGGKAAKAGKETRAGSAAAGKPGGSGSSPRAVHSGRPVCFAFNLRDGCKRQRGAADACRDPNGKLYAHYCNYFDRAKNAHCLAMHSRCANH